MKKLVFLAAAVTMLSSIPAYAHMREEPQGMMMKEHPFAPCYPHSHRHRNSDEKSVYWWEHQPGYFHDTEKRWDTGGRR
ncbi:MAG: hypothetical protein JO089_07920 [Alphaproteobacteria bacterium]|nr:hypothetical protein [Alphaproteobacteria bacterium]